MENAYSQLEKSPSLLQEDVTSAAFIKGSCHTTSQFSILNAGKMKKKEEILTSW